MAVGGDSAERLADAGVSVHHEHYEDTTHGFVGLMEIVDPGDDALAEELSDALGG